MGRVVLNSVRRRDPMEPAKDRSVRARLRGWLLHAAEQSEFWAIVLRIILAVRRGVWRGYYQTRRVIRTRAWRGAQATPVLALQVPRGRRRWTSALPVRIAR